MFYLSNICAMFDGEGLLYQHTVIDHMQDMTPNYSLT